ncbi:HypC/HybG/HupF family hydrogenase formation chaperone [bacterium]|nr:HypC/HybG/HupF family hydrogenase formation chaperone [bacterium]
MCLAIPGRIISIDGTTAIVDYGGVHKKASLLVLPDMKIGDMILVHAGFAIAKIDEKDAQETLDAFEKLDEAINRERTKFRKH